MVLEQEAHVQRGPQAIDVEAESLTSPYREVEEIITREKEQEMDGTQNLGAASIALEQLKEAYGDDVPKDFVSLIFPLCVKIGDL